LAASNTVRRTREKEVGGPGYKKGLYERRGSGKRYTGEPADKVRGAKSAQRSAGGKERLEYYRLSDVS